MTQKTNLRITLLAGLWFLAFGGLGLHLAIHPPAQETSNLIPFIAGLAAVILIPLLFSFKQTIAYAYVLNGMLAIIGTITMAKFKLAPDIAILWGKFLLGKALFELELLKNDEAPHRQGRFWRYPNMGYWYVHVVGLTGAFLLGYYYWQ
jgi:hypothetical protein